MSTRRKSGATISTTGAQMSLQLGGHEALQTATAITPLRMHTCFALYPFWVPSRKGYQDITIRFLDPTGRVTTYWAVTFDTKYGPPRELAYDLDSLVIARRLEEIGRPLPSLIPLGSMRAICRELGMQVNGKNFQNIRQALAQNQWARIVADIQYSDAQGLARRFNAHFNRYSLIYTGQQLPDGGTADGVYVLLNELYLTMLNNSRTRPLDYDYLRQLSHAARRFYEIVSFQIYAAIKYGHPEASISYSRLCLFSAQTRSFDSGYVSAQMGRIHRRHLDSGYLAGVRAEMVRDPGGDPDWRFYYKPGPRALREFEAFNRIRPKELTPADDQADKDYSTDILTGDGVRPEAPSPHTLVMLFHQAARNISNHTPLQKEVRQAAMLLERHGPVKSHFIILFAAKRARQTRFDVQQFGGLWVYLAEAEHAYEVHQRAVARSIEANTEQPNADEQYDRCYEAYERSRALAVEAIQAMRDGDREALEAQAIELINKRSPSMKRTLDRDKYRQNVSNVMCSIITQRLMEDQGFSY
ncbi:MAG TPA: hypothetical protein VJZ91_01275 [Blastocatellia bacterium]|nr:hypothetical protein [Blastocatellia bacterium]